MPALTEKGWVRDPEALLRSVPAAIIACASASPMLVPRATCNQPEHVLIFLRRSFVLLYDDNNNRNSYDEHLSESAHRPSTKTNSLI